MSDRYLGERDQAGYYDPMQDQHLARFFQRPGVRRHMQKQKALEALAKTPHYFNDIMARFHAQEFQQSASTPRGQNRVGPSRMEHEETQPNDQCVCGACFYCVAKRRRTDILHGDPSKPLAYILSFVPEAAATPRPPSALYRSDSSMGNEQSGGSRPASALAYDSSSGRGSADLFQSRPGSAQSARPSSRSGNVLSRPQSATPRPPSRSSGNTTPIYARSTATQGGVPIPRGGSPTHIKLHKRKKGGDGAQSQINRIMRSASATHSSGGAHQAHRDPTSTPTTFSKHVTFQTPTKGGPEQAQKTTGKKGKGKSKKKKSQQGVRSRESCKQGFLKSLLGTSDADYAYSSEQTLENDEALDLRDLGSYGKYFPKEEKGAGAEKYLYGSSMFATSGFEPSYHSNKMYYGKHFRAATVIQAWYNGCTARRMLRECVLAARKIQRVFRLHLAAKSSDIAAWILQKSIRGWKARTQFLSHGQRTWVKRGEVSSREHTERDLLRTHSHLVGHLSAIIALATQEPHSRLEITEDEVHDRMQLVSQHLTMREIPWRRLLEFDQKDAFEKIRQSCVNNLRFMSKRNTIFLQETTFRNRIVQDCHEEASFLKCATPMEVIEFTEEPWYRDICISKEMTLRGEILLFGCRLFALTEQQNILLQLLIQVRSFSSVAEGINRTALQKLMVEEKLRIAARNVPPPKIAAKSSPATPSVKKAPVPSLVTPPKATPVFGKKAPAAVPQVPKKEETKKVAPKSVVAPRVELAPSLGADETFALDDDDDDDSVTPMSATITPAVRASPPAAKKAPPKQPPKKMSVDPSLHFSSDDDDDESAFFASSDSSFVISTGATPQKDPLQPPKPLPSKSAIPPAVVPGGKAAKLPVASAPPPKKAPSGKSTTKSTPQPRIDPSLHFSDTESDDGSFALTPESSTQPSPATSSLQARKIPPSKMNSSVPHPPKALPVKKQPPPKTVPAVTVVQKGNHDDSDSEDEELSSSDDDATDSSFALEDEDEEEEEGDSSSGKAVVTGPVKQQDVTKSAGFVEGRRQEDSASPIIPQHQQPTKKTTPAVPSEKPPLSPVKVKLPVSSVTPNQPPTQPVATVPPKQPVPEAAPKQPLKPKRHPMADVRIDSLPETQRKALLKLVSQQNFKRDSILAEIRTREQAILRKAFPAIRDRYKTAVAHAALDRAANSTKIVLVKEEFAQRGDLLDAERADWMQIESRRKRVMISAHLSAKRTSSSGNLMKNYSMFDPAD